MSHANTYYIVPGEHLDDIGKAIRLKSNNSKYHQVKDMADAILGISTSSDLKDAVFQLSYRNIDKGVRVTASCTQEGRVTKEDEWTKDIIDNDLVSGNIKKDVNIFGVTGNLKELPSFKSYQTAANQYDVHPDKYFITEAGNIEKGKMPIATFQGLFSDNEINISTSTAGYVKDKLPVFVNESTSKVMIGPYIKSGVTLMGVEGKYNPPCKVKIYNSSAGRIMQIDMYYVSENLEEMNPTNEELLPVEEINISIQKGSLVRVQLIGGQISNFDKEGCECINNGNGEYWIYIPPNYDDVTITLY